MADERPPIGEPPDETPARRRDTRTTWMVDRDAEAALLGCILQGADPAIVDGAAWTTPGAQAVHHAATALYDTKPIDLRLLAARVGDELEQLQIVVDGHRTEGAHALVALVAAAPAASSAPAFAEIVTKHHRGRKVASLIARSEQALRGGDVEGAVAALEAAPDIAARPSRLLPCVTLDEFLNEDEPAYDWVIPDVIERTDRVLVTGGEGGGKSTLLRQIAIQAASGVHPFTLDDIDPLVVLIVDLENSRSQIRRLLRPLRISAGRRYSEDRLHIACIPDGIDLLERDDQHALTHLITTVKPDLVVGGPVYKLVGGDPIEEQPAKAAAMLLDRLRVEHGFALILETHQPHEASGSSKRPDRPYGASLWKRWPEFGLTIGATDTKTNVAELRHWRGPRDERDWPAALQRGGEWPWTVSSDRAATFARMCEIARDYAFAHGDLPSVRDLSKRMAEAGITISSATVQRAITNNKSQWDALRAQVVA